MERSLILLRRIAAIPPNIGESTIEDDSAKMQMDRFDQCQ